MRNLFGFLIKEKHPLSLSEPDGNEFIVKRVDEGMAARLRAMERENDTVRKTANFPPWLTHVFGIVLLCGVFLLAIAIELLCGEDGITYEFAVSCGFWWFLGFGAGLAHLSAGFFILQYFKNKAVMNSSAVKEHETKYEKIRKEALKSMLVPQDAVPMDVFSHPYIIKNGKQKGTLLADPLVNLPIYAFRDGEALCFASEEYVVRIPYDSIVSLSRISQKRIFVGWNQQEKYNKGAFKPYKIRMNSNGQMFVKFCYRVEICGSEAFELLIPPYEFEKLSPMLGYKALTVIDVKK